MHLKHPDYIKLVKEAYRKKKANNELSNLLAQPTRTNIKRACLHLYQEYYDNKEDKILKRDEHALTDFFGPAEHGSRFLQLIRNSEAERFRTLNNYLKDETESTESRNVELLAWLIDFPHRPFVTGMNVILSEEEIALINESTTPPEPTAIVPEPKKDEVQKNGEEKASLLNNATGSLLPKQPFLMPLHAVQKNDKAKGQFNRVAIYSLLFLSVIGIVYILLKKDDAQLPYGTTNTVCVYWASDHYQEVACEEEPRGRVIIPMSPERIKSFRRITRKDTITEWSIGKLYYIKNSNDIECYTEGGKYPENMSRDLNLLTRHMFNKYLPNGKKAVDDSLTSQATKLTIK